MMTDNLQHEESGLVLMTDQREQQPVGVVQPRPVGLAIGDMLEFFDLCGTKIPLGQRFSHLGGGVLRHGR